MPKQALIFEEKVIQVVASVSDIFPVHSNLTWVECPDNIEAYRANYRNNVFEIIPEPEQPAPKDEKLIDDMPKQLKAVVLAIGNLITKNKSDLQSEITKEYNKL